MHLQSLVDMLAGVQDWALASWAIMSKPMAPAKNGLITRCMTSVCKPILCRLFP